MREIALGDKTVRVRATALALLFYKQEFKSDLLGDLVRMQGIDKDMGKLDTVAFLQLAWAMAKADSFGGGEKFPSFMKWLETFEYLNLGDPKLFNDIMSEAQEGFFRRNRP